MEDKKMTDEFSPNRQNNDNGIMPQCMVVSCEHFTRKYFGGIVHEGCKFRHEEIIRPCSFYKKAPDIEKEAAK
jgi:hypothetical protein